MKKTTFGFLLSAGILAGITNASAQSAPQEKQIVGDSEVCVKVGNILKTDIKLLHNLTSQDNLAVSQYQDGIGIIKIDTHNSFTSAEKKFSKTVEDEISQILGNSRIVCVFNKKAGSNTGIEAKEYYRKKATPSEILKFQYDIERFSKLPY